MMPGMSFGQGSRQQERADKHANQMAGDAQRLVEAELELKLMEAWLGLRKKLHSMKGGTLLRVTFVPGAQRSSQPMRRGRGRVSRGMPGMVMPTASRGRGSRGSPGGAISGRKIDVYMVLPAAEAAKLTAYGDGLEAERQRPSGRGWPLRIMGSVKLMERGGKERIVLTQGGGRRGRRGRRGSGRGGGGKSDTGGLQLVVEGKWEALKANDPLMPPLKPDEPQGRGRKRSSRRRCRRRSQRRPLPGTAGMPGVAPPPR